MLYTLKHIKTNTHAYAHHIHKAHTHTAMHTQKYISGDKGWDIGLVRGGFSAQSHLLACFHPEGKLFTHTCG